MSDNIVQFPKQARMASLFDSEDLSKHDEHIEAVLTALICNLNGIYMTADVDWNSLMESCLIAATHCAKQAGMTAEDFNEMMNSIEVKDND